MLAWVGEAHGELFRIGVASLTTVMRSLLCYRAVRHLGFPGTARAARLDLTQSALRRGEHLAQEQGLVFHHG